MVFAFQLFPLEFQCKMRPEIQRAQHKQTPDTTARNLHARTPDDHHYQRTSTHAFNQSYAIRDIVLAAAVV